MTADATSASLVPEGTPPKLTAEQRAYWNAETLREFGISYDELERRVEDIRAGKFVTHEEAMRRLRAAPAVRPEGPEPERLWVDCTSCGARQSLHERIPVCAYCNAPNLLDPAPLSRDTGGAPSEDVCPHNTPLTHYCSLCPKLAAAHPPAEGRGTGEGMLTEEQFKAGMSEARRIVNSAVGYRFGGDLVPYASEFRSLALCALDEARARLASSSGRAAEPLPTLTDRHADAIEFVVMALDKVAPRTGGANLRGRAKDAARIIRENCRRASETPDEGAARA